MLVFQSMKYFNDVYDLNLDKDKSINDQFNNKKKIEPLSKLDVEIIDIKNDKNNNKVNNDQIKRLSFDDNFVKKETKVSIDKLKDFKGRNTFSSTKQKKNKEYIKNKNISVQKNDNNLNNEVSNNPKKNTDKLTTKNYPINQDNHYKKKLDKNNDKKNKDIVINKAINSHKNTKNKNISVNNAKNIKALNNSDYKHVNKKSKNQKIASTKNNSNKKSKKNCI